MRPVLVHHSQHGEGTGHRERRPQVEGTHPRIHRDPVRHREGGRRREHDGQAQGRHRQVPGPRRSGCRRRQASRHRPGRARTQGRNEHRHGPQGRRGTGGDRRDREEDDRPQRVPQEERTREVRHRRGTVLHTPDRHEARPVRALHHEHRLRGRHHRRDGGGRDGLRDGRDGEGQVLRGHREGPEEEQEDPRCHRRQGSEEGQDHLAPGEGHAVDVGEARRDPLKLMPGGSRR